MLLHHSGQGIQVARSDVRSECSPFWKRSPGSLDRGIDIPRGTLGNGGQLRAPRRIDGIEIFSLPRCLPPTIDEVSETMAVAVQPGVCFFRIFRRGPILHRNKFLSNAHASLDSPETFLTATTRSDDDTLRNNARSRGAPVAA